MLGNSLKKQAQLRESILAIVVILAVCYAGYSTFYSPKKAKSTELSTKLKELDDKKEGLLKLTKTLQTNNEKLSQEMQKQAQIKATQDPRIQMIQKYKDPVFKNVAAFLNALTQTEFRSSLVMESLKYDKPAEKKGYSEVKFFINASGKFANVIEFMQKLENVPALLTIDIINVQLNAKDISTVMIDFSGTYYQLGSDNG